ncbi:MAG: ABC transporter permease [Acidimicrobiales bacterium]
MKTAALIRHQYRYDQKQFWREPATVFFTVALPLIFLFIFVSIFGNEPTEVGDHTVKGATYYVPGILTLAMVSATILNLAITFTILREKGLLKRVRSTPLPPWVYLAGRVLTATVVTILLVVTVTVIGRLVYGVTIPSNTLPGLVLTVIVGTASCCALGFALTTVIPSENAAPAVTNAVILPLYFFSGIFIPNEQIPSGMRVIGDLFPVKHLFQALLTAFDPATSGTGIAWTHLAVLAAWGVAGGIIAVRWFRWTPGRA